MPEQGTGAGGSSSQGQGQAAAQPEWQAEKARLESEIASRDRQIRATTSQLNAWKSNVGRDLEGMLEFDQFGNPVRVVRDDRGSGRAMGGLHPMSGVVDDPTVMDQYYDQRFGQKFATQQQLQQMVNQAKNEAYAAARNDFDTLRMVDRTVAEVKDLGAYGSPLSQRTQQVLARNNWGKPREGAGSWDKWDYAAPEALYQAVQIAEAELFKDSQRQQQAQAQAQATQAAAGIAGTGSASAGGIASPSTEDMNKLASENPTEFDKRFEQDFQSKVQAGGR